MGTKILAVTSGSLTTAGTAAVGAVAGTGGGLVGSLLSEANTVSTGGKFCGARVIMGTIGGAVGGAVGGSVFTATNVGTVQGLAYGGMYDAVTQGLAGVAGYFACP